MWTIKPSNNQQFYEEGDDHKYWTLLIQGPKMEKRFNSAFKMFMRNQQRLPTSSTPKASALTSDQELGNISEKVKRFNSAFKMFMRNQHRLPTSSTPKSSALTSDQEMVNISEKVKRFNSAFKSFMRNQQRLTTSSTPKASALTSDQELGNISESERLSKRFNRALKVLLKSNNGFKNPEKCPCSLS